MGPCILLWGKKNLLWTMEKTALHMQRSTALAFLTAPPRAMFPQLPNAMPTEEEASMRAQKGAFPCIIREPRGVERRKSLPDSSLSPRKSPQGVRELGAPWPKCSQNHLRLNTASLPSRKWPGSERASPPLPARLSFAA